MLSVSDNTPHTPCPVPFNMARHVLARAAGCGDKPALELVGNRTKESWSFREVEAAVRGCATGLRERGLAAGDRVLLRLGDSPDFPIAYLACIAIDVVPVPTSSQLTAPEVSAIIADTAPRLIIADDAITVPQTTTPILSSQAFRAMRDLPPAEYTLGAPDRLAYIIYTSGTSGIPRAVMHAHRAVWARRMMWGGWYDLRETDRVLHAGAFNWTYTLGTGLMDPWAIGATALIPAPDTATATLGRLIEDHEATIFAAAPGVYRQLLKDEQHLNAPALRHGLSAGEKLPDATRTRWETLTKTKVHEAYGMSECSTFISGSPARTASDGVSGYAQPGRHIAVLDDAGQPVAIDTSGTLGVARDDPGLMLGYLNAPAEAKARFKNGYFLTGDTVSMATDGAITYLGRNDDMMNAGGYRVSPVEVEAALNSHPSVQECAIAEVTVKADVRVIAAFYLAASPLPDDSLRTYLEARLARYKIPRVFECVDALPKGANGKLLRKVLRETYEAQHGQT